MVLASWLASTFVDEAFKYPEAQTLISSFSAIAGYSLQIFLDFAGYTLIVTGLALLLGFSLPINFRQPYLARNLQDFWRRWHISLSTFIRDYVYIPLGGNRHGLLTLAYVGLAWVFFRADTNEVALQLLAGLTRSVGNLDPQHGLLAVFILSFFFLSARAERIEQACLQQLTELKWIPLTLLVSSLGFMTILLGPSGVPSFIYYRF